VAGVEGLVLDDLHFADAATIEMLDDLAMDGAVIKWGFAQRPAEGLAQAKGLRDVLAKAWKLETIVLEPLDESQMTEFVESLRIPGVSAARLAPHLLKTTGGNPLFALETLKSAVFSGAALDDDASTLPRPASVAALVERRLAQLTPRALAL